MKQATKAVLLSALVFPGAGHFYLKRWIEGVLLSGAAACALYFIFAVAWDTALAITEKIQSGAVPADPLVISDLVSQQLQASAQTTSTATIVLTACWVIGMAGSYWSARKRDSQ